MRIVCISDTHSLHDRIQVPDGDLLIHAGDFSGHGSERDVIECNRFLGSLPHKHKIITAGNHDFLCEKMPALAQQLFTHAKLLLDQEVTIDGKRIFMSPWTPRYGHWAYMRPREAMKQVWERIPEGIDILVTHGPPATILDTVEDWYGGKIRPIPMGCSHLLTRVKQVRPKLHVFGHIHEGHGQLVQDGIHFVNAAICTRHYRPTNPPIVVDL